MRHPEPQNPDGVVVNVAAELARGLNTAVANRARRWLFHHPDDAPLAGVLFNPNPRRGRRPG
jgi:hypothetical protein